MSTDLDVAIASEAFHALRRHDRRSLAEIILGHRGRDPSEARLMRIRWRVAEGSRESRPQRVRSLGLHLCRPPLGFDF